VFTGTIKGNPIGKDWAWLALTVDNGATLDTDGPSCAPLYGTLILGTGVDREEISATGTSCNGGPGFVISGWAIAASAAGLRAEGTAFNGTFNPGTAAGTIKYSGNGY